MTYDEWVKYIAKQNLPSPPGSVNLPKQGVPPLLQRQAPTPPPGFNSNVEADLARFGRDAPGNVMAASNAAINPIDFAGASTADIDINEIIESIKNSFATEPPGFRDMPRSPNVPFLRERNTTVIPGREEPDATPYPRPPFLNLGHFLDTGERGPLPLNSRRPGYYPQPANEQMPEAYEHRTSGGGLAQIDLPEPMSGGRQLFEMMNNLRKPVPSRGDTPDDMDKAYRLQQLMYELERARIMNDRPNLSQGILPQRPFNAA